MEGLKKADSEFDLKYMMAYMMKYLRENPKLNFQDFETFLRKNLMNTYVIAVPPYAKVSEGCKLLNPNDDTIDVKYQIILSCRPEPFAMMEMLNYSYSYSENFEKLGISGLYTVESEDCDMEGLPNLHLLSTDEKEYYNKI
jgi:hypothetical protein